MNREDTFLMTCGQSDVAEFNTHGLTRAFRSKFLPAIFCAGSGRCIGNARPFGGSHSHPPDRP
jgi:hypothetical protein